MACFKETMSNSPFWGKEAQALAPITTTLPAGQRRVHIAGSVKRHPE
jgi:hypothetical protein